MRGERPAVADAALERMLVARANRFDAHLDPVVIVRHATAIERTPRPGRAWALGTSLGLGVTALVLVLAGSLAIGTSPPPTTSSTQNGSAVAVESPGQPTGPSFAATSVPTVNPTVPTGPRWTVEEIAQAQTTDPFVLADGRLMAVRGWLVATPPLRCLSRPVPSGTPSWGCDEMDWITGEPFQPWVSDATSGSTRVPSVGLRVQVGAYARFASAHREQADPVGPNAPALGTYLVRGSIHEGCETIPLPASSDSPPCVGPAIALWEVVGTVPDDVQIIGPLVLPSRRPGSTPVPGTDGSGDTPCLPAGTPCGEDEIATPMP